MRYFAYPYGHHHNLTSESFELAQRSGYRGICSAYGGYNFPGDNAFHLQRIHPDNDLIRLKNWLTVDPRKLRGIRRFVIRPHRKVVYGPDREAILNDLYARPEAFPAETSRDEATDSGLVPLGPPEPISPELLPGLDVAQPVREAAMPGVAALAVDTLATSVVLMLAMTVLQRLIGFARGIAFCRLLDPEQLGQWDVAFGFINLAAPLAVLGLPG